VINMLDTSDIIRLAAKFGLAPYRQERFKQGYVHFYQRVALIFLAKTKAMTLVTALQS